MGSGPEPGLINSESGEFPVDVERFCQRSSMLGNPLFQTFFTKIVELTQRAAPAMNIDSIHLIEIPAKLPTAMVYLGQCNQDYLGVRIYKGLANANMNALAYEDVYEARMVAEKLMGLGVQVDSLFLVGPDGQRKIPVDWHFALNQFVPDHPDAGSW